METYPDFNSDLLISLEKSVPKVYVNKILTNKLKNTELTIDVKEMDDKTRNYKRDWISTTSFINIHVSDKFIEKHYELNSDDYRSFLGYFKELINPFTELTKLLNQSEKKEKSRPTAIFSTFYHSEDNFILQFIFDLEEDIDKYIQAFKDSLDLIRKYKNNEKHENVEQIKNSYSQSNGIKYLTYTKENWTVINPMIEIGKEINEEYRKDKDSRVKKPQVIMQKDALRKYFVFDNNWVLHFNSLETMLTQPNDISLYSNISKNNLQRAKEFYDENIYSSDNAYHKRFPIPEKEKEYYDYFELIITALLFAYTSLEAFANICIPYFYEYTTENNGVKNIYSKEAIEKRFTLRDKFKKIIKEILSTPDPTKTSWWDSFIKLEDIRNEIIHTKQSKSEERYSKLLDKQIFDLVSVHDEIIRYYGFYIDKNKKELLEEYPYDFGFDDLFPSLIDEYDYEKLYETLYNPKR